MSSGNNSDASEASVAEPVAGSTVSAPSAYVIPRALAQATLDYLAAQPYREVFALVQAFEALEPVEGTSAQSLE
jgi:hypothetical protein